MEDVIKKLTMHDRVSAVLKGEKPDRPPFIDRMEIWYKSCCQDDTLPEKFRGMSLNEVHKAVGMGQQKFSSPYAHKLRGVEVICTFKDETIYREYEPVMEFFPAAWAPSYVIRDKAGDSVIEFITPVGKVGLKYSVSESLLSMVGIEPYLMEHLVKEESDYRTAEYILEHTEFVAQFENIFDDEAELGDNGFVVPCLHRIPFQQLLLEYLGEIPLFNALYDSPRHVKRLIDVLDQWFIEVLHHLSDFPGLYVEFVDNLDGVMTNPNLFEKYCLPYYQRYAEILHGQGKKVGSHTDGNLKPLLNLLAESGLDVCESFSPAPLTECTFEEAWDKWKNGPIIWGGIPSTILEERTKEKEFREYVQRLLEIIEDRPIILGVGDMVLNDNLIERVEYIGKEVEWKRGN